ncbi:MAG TPA: T9SS type A sorting domain-containing protein [Saprospiraceae bacterium]|nr:T9SS type A sorting domain-containing protein [Saprospiraceae bacterium]
MPGLSKHFIFGGLLLGLIYSAAQWTSYAPPRFHTPQEIQAFHANSMLEVVDSNVIFPTSKACVGCHGRDENGYASVDLAGNDVNVVDDWSATMMANSAKDPFWRAKVSHEILIHPMHSAAIQDKCTSCHAPNGRYTAHYRGHGPYSIADMLADSIGMDGVSCSTCHKISQQDFGLTFSGQINFDTARVIYGPYYEPFAAPMEDFVGFRPLHGQHVPEAGLCAPCHTLITHPVNAQGEFLDIAFVEQATYHEWLNSTYGLQNVTCQDCHFPRIKDPVVISSNYLFLDGRVPFGIHEMAGANTMMLRLMKQNRQALGITASAENYDATIAATYAMLQDKTLNMELQAETVRSDSVTFALKLTNRAGHKFPSGYPSRRALVSFVALTEQGDTLFRSGMLQPDYEVEGHDPVVEPHYQMITRPDQAQIYEMVMGDAAGQLTTVLLRGYEPLKDNRLPPLGFRTTHSAYDTTRIFGNALNDPDFNKVNGVEGTGSDIVRYRISVNGYQGNIRAYATVYYQSLPPKWMEEIFADSTPEIETFRTMFNNADRSPVAVSLAQTGNVYVDGVTAARESALQQAIRVFPNPAPDGKCQVLADGLNVLGIRVFDAKGRWLKSLPAGTTEVSLSGRGVFLLEIRTDKGTLTQRVLAR